MDYCEKLTILPHFKYLTGKIIKQKGKAMKLLATTKMSSKGQVVIPEDVRKSLKLKTGDQFIVIGRGDAVILKTISAPAFNEFSDMLDEVQKKAKSAGLKKSVIDKIIRDVRKSK